MDSQIKDEDIPELQRKIKQQPELYVDEVLKIIEEFKKEFEKVKLSPSLKNERFINLSVLLSQV
jgi:hypothetical protein